MNNRTYIDALTAELESHGCTDYGIEHGGKHPRLVFTFNGETRFYVFPASPSDNRRGVLNAVAELRQIMGVKRKIQKSARPKRARNRAETKITSLSMTVKDNPFDALPALLDPDRAHVEALRERTNLALYRLSFFKGSYRDWKRQESAQEG